MVQKKQCTNETKMNLKLLLHKCILNTNFGHIPTRLMRTRTMLNVRSVAMEQVVISAELSSSAVSPEGREHVVYHT